MTRALKITAAIIVTGVFLGATACLLMMVHQSRANALSLVFEKYGTTEGLGLNAQDVTCLWFTNDVTCLWFTNDVAFLWFTNSSDKSYGLPMMGSTNTFQHDTPLDLDSVSYLIRWEYGDQPEPVPRVSFASLGRCLVVAPHSAVRLRVPLLPQGQKQRVAVLCAEVPSGSPRQFWTKGIGLSLLRRLPHSVGMKLLFAQPAVLRVWSDRELSRPDERQTK